MSRKCPNHADRNLAKNGRTKAGSPRWRCTACGYSETDSEYIHGTLPIGDTAMTNAEKQWRFRLKRKTK